MLYNQYSSEEQSEICKEFKKDYPDTSIFIIAYALSNINPTVELKDGVYTIWDAYKAKFEKLIKD